MDDLRAYLGEQFALLGTLLGGMDRRLDRLEHGVEQAGARLGRVEGRLEQVEARLDQMDRRFEQVEARLDRMDRRFEQVEARFDKIDGWLDEFHGRLIKLEGLEETVRDLGTYVNERLAKVDKQLEESNRGLAALERVAESLHGELGLVFKEQRLVYEAMALRDDQLRANLNEMHKVLVAWADRFDVRMGRLELRFASVMAGADEAPPAEADGP